MYNKLNRINNIQIAERIKKLKPKLLNNKTNRNGVMESFQIKLNNKRYFQNLKKKFSLYSLKQFNKDYERSQYFKKNICEFPSINFKKPSPSPVDKKISEIKKECNSSIISDKNFFKLSKFKHTDVLNTEKKIKKII